MPLAALASTSAASFLFTPSAALCYNGCRHARVTRIVYRRRHEVDDDYKFPWFCAWMIFISATGLWTTVSQVLHGDAYIVAGCLVGSVIFAALGIVGIWHWREASRTRDGAMQQILRPYRTAWNDLFRRRWLFAAFGCVWAVNLLGGMPGQVGLGWRTEGIYSYGASGVWDRLLSLTPGAIRGAADTLLARFFPGPGFQHSPVQLALLALVVLVACILIRRRLTRLAEETEYADGARFVTMLTVPLVIASLAVAVGSPLVHLMTVAHVSEAAAKHSPLAGYRPQFGVMALTNLLGALYTVAVSAAFMAGLAGSLRRQGQDEVISADTFLRDVVRWFRPLAGVYLMMVVAYFVAGLPVLLRLLISPRAPSLGIVEGLGAVLPIAASLLFAFSPYAVVTHGLKPVGALQRSVQDWSRRPWQVVSFVAAGIAILIIPAAALLLIPGLVPVRGLANVLAGTVSVTARTLIVAFLAVAVWEFYRRISADPSAQGG